MKLWRRRKPSTTSSSKPVKKAKGLASDPKNSLNADYFLDDGEPLSYDEEVTLHHASQYPHLTQDYSFQYKYRRNSGKPVAATPAPTGTLSIESILNSNPDLLLGPGYDSASSLHNSSYPSSIRTNTGTKMMRRLSSRLSFRGNSHSDESSTQTHNTSTSDKTSPSSSAVDPGTASLTGAISPPRLSANTPPQSVVPQPASRRASVNTSFSSPSKQPILKVPAPYPSGANSSGLSFSSRSSPGVGSPISNAAISTTQSDNGNVPRPPPPHTTSQISPIASNPKQPAPPGNSNLWAVDDKNANKTLTMVSTESSNVGSVSSNGDQYPGGLPDMRDGSLSAPGPLECSSSPVSSLIFERSVQEFGSPIDEKLPAHYLNENFIPPVLEASANAITDNSADPDTIEVISLRTRHMSISPMQESAPDFATVTNVAFAGSTDSSVLSPPNLRPPSPAPSNGGSPASPSTEGAFSRKASMAEMPSLRGTRSLSIPLDKNQHVLTFYSYADIVSSEGTTGGYTSPKSSTNSPIVPEYSTGHSFSSSVPRIPGGLEERLSPTSTVGLMEDSPDELVSSMRETLRRNTGELAAHHHG